MKGRPVALAADLHLTPGADEEASRLASLVETAAASASSLYFLGDLFDFWVGRGMESWSPWGGFLEVFRSAPFPLFFLPGNRDFLAGRRQLERMGLRYSSEETLLEDPGGRKWLLLHGDQLCTRDRDYQKARRILRSLPARGVTRFLPFFMKLRVARALRKRSARSLPGRDPACLAPTREAVLPRLEGGADGILCGHVHQAGCFSLSAEKEPVLFVLPPWVERGEWVLLVEDGPRRMGPGGEEVPWPPREVLV